MKIQELFRMLSLAPKKKFQECPRMLKSWWGPAIEACCSLADAGVTVYYSDSSINIEVLDSLHC
jgi:hypothetical protein